MKTNAINKHNFSFLRISNATIDKAQILKPECLSSKYKIQQIEFFDQEDNEQNCWKLKNKEKENYIYIPKWNPKFCYCQRYATMRIQKENKYIYIGCQNYQSGGCDFFQLIPTGARNHRCKLYKYAFNDKVFENYNPDKNKRLIIQEQLIKINKELRKQTSSFHNSCLKVIFIRQLNPNNLILKNNVSSQTI
ncbi:hypothetical protein ABPG72_016136 [Tetrahymena utriculariae]